MIRHKLRGLEYPRVKHSHVVPAGYLRAWASNDRIALRRSDSDEATLVGVRDAGVRTNFYRRHRPDSGEAIYDIEWSLAQGEAAAIPVIASCPASWPLSLESKSKIGQFFALQCLRGATFKTWHEEHIAEQASILRSNPLAHATPPPGMTHAEAVERAIEALSSDTYRVTRMLSLVRALGIVFTSMRWTLVRFRKGRLATSDHPVVVWPLARDRVEPRANDLRAGVFDTFEVFAPVSPDHLLLMTWLHDEDETVPRTGEGRHLATANAFVIANADTQWFHEPGVTPWTANGRRAPLSRDLVDGYDVHTAAASPLRAKTIELARAEVAAPLSNDPVSVASVARGPRE